MVGPYLGGLAVFGGGNEYCWAGMVVLILCSSPRLLSYLAILLSVFPQGERSQRYYNSAFVMNKLPKVGLEGALSLYALVDVRTNTVRDPFIQ